MPAIPEGLVMLAFGAGVGATLGVQSGIRERAKNRDALKNDPTAAVMDRGGRLLLWGCAPISFAAAGAGSVVFLAGIVLAIWELIKWVFEKVLS
jgi:hypothetical protein